MIVGGLLLSRRTGRSRPLPPPGPLAPRMGPGDLRTQAQALIAQGKQIHAVKLVREQTGMRLVEAKRYVDDLAAGRMPATPPAFPAPPGVPRGGDLADRVRGLKASGRAEQAVLLVRGETGMAEDEARSFVDAIR
ncbi:50S ribosomal protein L7/L12 [Planomonospora venezuelensis]|uniref:Ribosomal protein L7/L12 C-terminal domain-containing protein n=2 Tax=Planomonospora venezuelensis TaxID=1999 RepID=A0A841DCU7_PLAVE|nr:50S ribosomal protein L7/L12 [Planomonospora venezuelensis]MBB5967890.1 hypothetical protein [Planomonospora venezuelensis]